MHRFISFALGLFLITLSLTGNTAPAQQAWSKQQGDYMVYYSVFNSQFISPKVAEAYGIVRAPNRALVNISVTKIKSDGSETLGQPALIEGYAQNLMAVKTDIDFRPVEHPGTVYYIAEFRYSSREVINFYFDVTPEGSNKAIELSFSKKLYHEDQ